MDKFVIKETKNKFYFDDTYNSHLIDNDIALLLSIKVDDYQTKLISDFGGFIGESIYTDTGMENWLSLYRQPQTFFSDFKNAKRALEWIESILVMNKLTEVDGPFNLKIYEKIGLGVVNTKGIAKIPL